MTPLKAAICVLGIYLCVYGISGETLNAAQPSTGKLVLVLLDDLSVRATHSVFFDWLQENNYDVEFRLADDPTLALQLYGEYLYDHLFLFAPSVEEFGGFVDTKAILEFIDAGHNVLFAADSDLSDTMRELASECGVEFDDTLTSVIDHVNFDESDFDGDHTLIVADVQKNDVVFGKGTKVKEVLFRGIGHAVENGELHRVLVRGAATSFSAEPNKIIEEEPLIAGTSTVLASILQARNNARVGFFGSLEMCSDAFVRADLKRFGSKGSARLADNEAFCTGLAGWVMQRRGLLRASAAKHEHADTAVAMARSEYRIRDKVLYTINIEEYDGEKDAWKPFVVKDMQLEFIMLDPYWRQYLVPKGGKYELVFELPDVYGVFTFRTVYHRPGYAHIESITRTPVRPYRHDEYERFIGSAYPYYASALSMLAGLFLFSSVFLFHRD